MIKKLIKFEQHPIFYNNEFKQTINFLIILFLMIQKSVFFFLSFSSYQLNTSFISFLSVQSIAVIFLFSLILFLILALLFHCFFIYNLALLGMNDKKEQIYVMTLHITKITLRVRFPCYICCTIKIDGTELELSGETELHNGLANLNLTHITEIQIPTRKELFSQEKKCMLMIYLKSTSGRIPAGSVPLPLARAENKPTKEMSRIDKCPDKNAFIQYQIKLEKIQEKKEHTTDTTLEKDLRYFKNENSHKNIKLIKSQVFEKNLEERNEPIRHLVDSKVDISSEKSKMALRRLASKKEEGQRSSLFETYYSGQRKNGDIDKIFTLEREIDSYKTKVMILENQNISKNQRNSEYERQVKQFQKKIEQLEMELKSATSKNDYAERTNKDLVNQIKQFKQKFQEDKLGFENTLKRFEIRQNNYKEQIKTLSEKLYGSQNQKQRMIYQKYLSSDQFQGRQKKLRQSFKEKEKKLLEQRTSLLKKVDSLEKDIDKFKEDIAQSKTKNTDSIQNVHDLKIIIQSIQTQKQKFRNQCNDLKFQLTRMKNQKHVLEENLDTVGKFNDERRNFRKQISDKDVQNSQLKDRIASLEGQINRLRSQNQEIDKVFKDKCNNLKLLQRDYNIILKENSILQGDVANKQAKIESLINELQLEMKRSKFLQGSATELEEQFESKQEALERQLRQSCNYRIILQQEVDKLNHQLESSNRQLLINMKDIQELEQTIEQKNELITSLESQMIQLNTINQQLQLQKIDLGQDKKELQEKYQQLAEDSQEHRKQLNQRILMISQKWQENASQLERSLAESNQKIKLLNHALKEKEDHLIFYITENQELEKKLETAFREKQNLIAQQTKQSNQLSIFKDSYINLQKETSDKEAIIESLRNQIESLQQQSSQMEKNYEHSTSDLKNMQIVMTKIKDEYDSYKQGIYNLFDSIAQNIKPFSTSLFDNFQTDQICNQKARHILSLIFARNKQYEKNIEEKFQKISKLQSQLQCLIQERDLKQQGLLAAGQHLELLKRNTSQFSDELTNKNAIINQLNDSLKFKEKQIQDLQSENNKKIVALNTIINQKIREASEMNFKNNELEQMIQRLSLQLKNTSNELKRLEKEKKNIENDQKSKLILAESTLRSEMERVNTLEADKSFLQKQLRQERENLRKVMRQLQNKCYEFEDLQLKLEQNDSIGSLKESELKKNRQKNQKLKLLLDLLLTINTASSRAKLQKFFNDPSSKENELLEQKTRAFIQNYQNLTANIEELHEGRKKYPNSVSNLSAQLEICRSQSQTAQIAQGKALSETQAKLQELSKIRQKEIQSKLDLLKGFEQQKMNADYLRRLSDENLKLLATLQKQKKASVFVIAPVKEVGKKIEDLCAQMMKGITTIINKNRREWDLANIRAKKNNSKKEETFSSIIRP